VGFETKKERKKKEKKKKTATGAKPNIFCHTKPKN